METLRTTVHGSVSLLTSQITTNVLTDYSVKGLADGEVQVLKSKVLDAQGPDAAV